MQKIKKISAVLLCVCLISSFGILTACSSDKPENDNTRLNIVCTIFPVYDWVREILGDKAEDTEITMLLDNGVDLHSYQPTANDIIQIENCDMFIYIGGESDDWVEDILEGSYNHDMKVINLLEILGNSAKEEVIIEGMQSEEADEDSDEIEYDEHIWLSIKNAEFLCSKIAEAVSEIDPKNAEIYKTNSAVYSKKLSELDNQYQNAVNDADKKVLLFGDRFPFRYLTDDYELEYYAAFAGCSAETEASFETIAFLSDKVDELDLSCVLTIEGSNQKIAETIISNTKNKDQKVLAINSLQSITSEDVKNGTTYLSVMQNNLEILQDALK